MSDYEHETHPRTLVRADGNDTSHIAAYALDVNRLEGLVYEVIHSFGEQGCISDQVRHKLPELSYSSVTGRYRALLDKGWIEDTGERRKGASGRPQRVMRRKSYDA